MEEDRQAHGQMLGSALKMLVGAHLHADIEIPRLPSQRGGLARARKPQAHACLHPGGDAQLQLGPPPHAPLAPASGTRIFCREARASALGAGALGGEDPPALHPPPAPLARGAGCGGGVLLLEPVASQALQGTGDLEAQAVHGPGEGLLQRDPHRRFHIAPAPRAPFAPPATEEPAEGIAERPPRGGR